jgi:SsrA-binding protein
MTVLAVNKRAHFDYEILGTYEAGVVLFGHEVKSIKTGHVSLKGSYVTFKSAVGAAKLPEIYLVNAHIPYYKFAAPSEQYDPYRSRKLLLKKNELRYLVGKKQEKGLTLVPLKLYTKRSLIKLEFGIGRGKKQHDKREAIKKRDVERQMRTLTKQGR